jgi:hypothetical protein
VTISACPVICRPRNEYLHFTPTYGSWLNLVEVFFRPSSAGAAPWGLRERGGVDRSDPPLL